MTGMTKAQIHEKLGVEMLMLDSEANRELQDDEATEYQGMMEHVLTHWKTLIDERKNGKPSTSKPDRAAEKEF